MNCTVRLSSSRANDKSAGNSGTAVSYADDDRPPSAVAFYRLAQYDVNGAVTYSSIVKTKRGPANEFRITPNPVSSSAFVLLRPCKGQGNLILYDAAGRQVRKQSAVWNKGWGQSEVNTTSLARGLYALLHLQEGVVTGSETFIKQ